MRTEKAGFELIDMMEGFKIITGTHCIASNAMASKLLVITIHQICCMSDFSICTITEFLENYDSCRFQQEVPVV